MDQEHGMDPEVKRLFRKILSALSYGLLWLIAVVTAGLYFKLAWREGNRSIIYTILFYLGMLISLGFLLRYYYNLWKSKF